MIIANPCWYVIIPTGLLELLSTKFPSPLSIIVIVVEPVYVYVYSKVLGLIYSPNNFDGIDIIPILAPDSVGKYYIHWY